MGPRKPRCRKAAVFSGRRYYSPELGRWLNRDPVRERGGRQLYAFLGNRATDAWDLLGLFCGECAPPSPGFPNYHDAELKSVVYTGTNSNPFTDDTGLLDTISNYQAVVNILQLVKGAVQSTGDVLQFLADWVSGKANPAGFSTGQKNAIDYAVTQFQNSVCPSSLSPV